RKPLSISACTHSAPARVLPAPRPPRNNHVPQSLSGGNCAGLAQNRQSFSIPLTISGLLISSNHALRASRPSEAIELAFQSEFPGLKRIGCVLFVVMHTRLSAFGFSG